MTDQPDHRPAPGTALGPPARVRAVVDDGRGDRVVLQGGGGVALQQLFAGADAPDHAEINQLIAGAGIRGLLSNDD